MAHQGWAKSWDRDSARGLHGPLGRKIRPPSSSLLTRRRFLIPRSLACVFPSTKGNSFGHIIATPLEYCQNTLLIFNKLLFTITGLPCHFVYTGNARVFYYALRSTATRNSTERWSWSFKIALTFHPSSAGTFVQILGLRNWRVVLALSFVRSLFSLLIAARCERTLYVFIRIYLANRRHRVRHAGNARYRHPPCHVAAGGDAKAFAVNFNAPGTTFFRFATFSSRIYIKPEKL